MREGMKEVMEGETVTITEMTTIMGVIIGLMIERDENEEMTSEISEILEIEMIEMIEFVGIKTEKGLMIVEDMKIEKTNLMIEMKDSTRETQDMMTVRGMMTIIDTIIEIVGDHHQVNSVVVQEGWEMNEGMTIEMSQEIEEKEEIEDLIEENNVKIK